MNHPHTQWSLTHPHTVIILSMTHNTHSMTDSPVYNNCNHSLTHCNEPPIHTHLITFTHSLTGSHIAITHSHIHSNPLITPSFPISCIWSYIPLPGPTFHWWVWVGLWRRRCRGRPDQGRCVEGWNLLLSDRSWPDDKAAGRGMVLTGRSWSGWTAFDWSCSVSQRGSWWISGWFCASRSPYKRTKCCQPIVWRSKIRKPGKDDEQFWHNIWPQSTDLLSHNLWHILEDSIFSKTHLLYLLNPNSLETIIYEEIFSF